MRRYAPWFTYVVIAVILQLGVILTVFSVSGIKFTLYNLFTPVVFIVALYLASFKFKVSRAFLTYLSLNIGLLGAIILTGESGLPLRMVLAYGLGLSLVIAFNVDSTSHRSSSLFYGFFIGALPAIVLDIAAFAGLIPLNEASVVIPGMTRGGIGIPGGAFGTHGIVVSTGIISGLGILHSSDEFGYKQKFILFCLPVMAFMVVASQSRSSMLALLFGVAVLFLYRFRNRFDNRVAAGVLLVIAGFITTIGVFLARQRMKTLLGRLDQLEVAFTVVQSNMLSGIGWENFFPEYYSHVIHFTPANYFVSGGILVGLLFLLILVYPILTVIRLSTNSDGRYVLPLIVVSAMYVVVVTEIMFYKSTPNVHLLVIGGFICNSSVGMLNRES